MPGIALKQNVFKMGKVQEIVLENCMKGVNCELGVVPVWRFQDIWIDGLLTGRLKEVDWFKVQTHSYSSNKPPLWKFNIKTISNI